MSFAEDRSWELKDGPDVGGRADAEDRAFAVWADADGNENGAVQKSTTLADLFGSGVQDHIRAASQGVIAPCLEFGIEFAGAVARLGGTDGVAAKLLDDIGDLAGGDALNVHLGESEKNGLFAAGPFFKALG